jgi:hypothetical protein
MRTKALVGINIRNNKQPEDKDLFKDPDVIIDPMTIQIEKIVTVTPIKNQLPLQKAIPQSKIKIGFTIPIVALPTEFEIV